MTLSLFEQYKSIQAPEIKPKTFSIIYGAPGLGKSTLAISSYELGKIMVLNFENRLGHCQTGDNIVYVPSRTSVLPLSSFRVIVNNIEANKETHGIDYIVIDTIDSMFQNFKDAWIEKKQKEHPSKNITNIDFEGRNEAINTLLPLIKRLKNSNVNIIAVCHERNIKKENKKTDKLTIDLDTDFKNHINKLVDNIFYLDVDENDNRILCTQPTYIVQAKQSVPLGYSYPEIIVDPAWKDIKIVKIEQQTENAETGKIETAVKAEDKTIESTTETSVTGSNSTSIDFINSVTLVNPDETVLKRTNTAEKLGKLSL